MNSIYHDILPSIMYVLIHIMMNIFAVRHLSVNMQKKILKSQK